VRTLIGTGEAGEADGDFAHATLNEPAGVAVVGDRLYIADTNNHCIRVADLSTRIISTFFLRGLDPPSVSALAPARTEVRLAPITVAPGPIEISFDLQLPPAAKPNPTRRSPLCVTRAAGTP
jgi:hypothetical protein